MAIARLPLLLLIFSTLLRAQTNRAPYSFQELLINYDKSERPGRASAVPDRAGKRPENTPLEISVSLKLEHISIDGAAGELDLQCLLKQFWKDDRLSSDNNNGSSLRLRGDQVNKLWLPDTLFLYEKVSGSEQADTPLFVQLSGDGEIETSKKHRVSIANDLALQRFPFDRQEIKIRLMSLTHTIDEIVYRWHTPPFIIRDTSKLVAGFDVTDVEYYECKSEMATGEHSCIEMKLLVKRNFIPFLLRVLSPVCTLVLVALLALFLNPSRHATARVLLPALLLVAIVFFVNDMSRRIPETPYIKAIDMWLGICVSIPFFVLLQSILAVSPQSAGDHYVSEASETLLLARKATGKRGKCASAVRCVDYFARVLLPLLFIVVTLSIGFLFL